MQKNIQKIIKNEQYIHAAYMYRLYVQYIHVVYMNSIYVHVCIYMLPTFIVYMYVYMRPIHTGHSYVRGWSPPLRTARAKPKKNFGRPEPSLKSDQSRWGGARLSTTHRRSAITQDTSYVKALSYTYHWSKTPTPYTTYNIHIGPDIISRKTKFDI